MFWGAVQGGIPGRLSRMQCRSGVTAGACDPDSMKATAEGAVSIASIDPDFYIFTPTSRQHEVLPLKDATDSEDTVNSFPYDDAPPDSRGPRA